MTATEKCRATSKRTGQRCGQWPIPGGAVCKWHGGATPQVKRAAAERLALAKLRESVSAVDPGQALQDVLSLAYTALAQLRDSHGDDPAKMDLFGTWLDRVGRLSKQVIDAQVQLDPQKQHVAQVYGRQMVTMLRILARVLGYDPDAAVVVNAIRLSLESVSGDRSEEEVARKAVLPSPPWHDEAQLTVNTQLADEMYEAIVAVVRGLGHDPDDPDVRAVIHGALEGL